MKRSMKLLLATISLGCATLAPSVEAGPLLSRPALQALLGGPGTLEDFEAFSVTAGTAQGLDCAVLNSTAICNGQGPDLVVAGIDITFTVNGQWDGAGYFDAPSKEILSAQPLAIDFGVSVNAFGIDLRTFSGFPATATMTILGLDDTTVIGTFSGISLPSSGVPVFAGWEDSAGIGRVTFSQTDHTFSPIIDNLEFGNRIAAVPEPSVLVLFALGLLGLLGVPPLRCNSNNRAR